MKSFNFASGFYKKSQVFNAFLAALVGLAVFKEELQSLTVTIFTLDFSILQLTVPLIIFLLLASYLAALSYMADSLHKYPVRGYLRNGSMLLAMLSLIYPIAIGLALPMSWGIDRLESGISPVLSQMFFVAVSFAVGLLTAIKSSKRISTLEYQEVTEEVINSSFQGILPKASPNAGKSEINWAGFLTSYERMRSQLKKFLDITGYGTSGEDLFGMAVVLRGQGLMDSKEVKLAEEVVEIRKRIIHGENISPKEVSTMVSKYNKMSALVRSIFIDHQLKARKN